MYTPAILGFTSGQEHHIKAVVVLLVVLCVIMKFLTNDSVKQSKILITLPGQFENMTPCTEVNNWASKFKQEYEAIENESYNRRSKISMTNDKYLIDQSMIY